MNIITKAFLSTILFGGLMYSMDAPMSKEEFLNKFNQFKNFKVKNNNKQIFKEKRAELLSHLSKDIKSHNCYRSIINGIYTEKMHTMGQDLMDIEPNNIGQADLDAIKGQLYSPQDYNPLVGYQGKLWNE